MGSLFYEPGPVRLDLVNAALERGHYLGAARDGVAWSDELGIAVLGQPTSRRLPRSWLELSRWMLSGGFNAGSMQWARIVRWLRRERRDVTTVVSYSDPSVGHDGVVYRAANWVWCPTWHRLVTPPTGNGAWAEGAPQAAKDRWVYPLRRDPLRRASLALDDTYLRRFPEARDWSRL